MTKEKVMLEVLDAIPPTECACQGCRIPCKHIPGVLSPTDVMRIASVYGDGSDQWIAEHYAASPGSLAIFNGKLIRIGTIVPKQREDGSCIFLDENERCSVHQYKPFGCGRFDTHMGDEEADRRSQLAHLAIMGSEFYSVVHSILVGLGSVAPPLEQRRAAVQKAWAEMEATT